MAEKPVGCARPTGGPVRMETRQNDPQAWSGAGGQRLGSVEDANGV